MEETGNLWITVDLSEKFGLPINPLLPKVCGRHFELRLDALEGEIVQLLVKLLEELRICVEAIEVPELNFESSEEGLLRTVAPRR